MCTLCTLHNRHLGCSGRVVLDTYFGVILEVVFWVILGHVQNHPYFGVLSRGVVLGVYSGVYPGTLYMPLYRPI